MSYQGIRRRKAAPPARRPLPDRADCPVCEGSGFVSYGAKVLPCLGCTYVPVPAYEMKPGGLASIALAGIVQPWQGKRRDRFWKKRNKADELSRAYWASVRKDGSK